jgi:carbon storage regulator
MLVLTRRPREQLFIGDDVCVTVIRLEGGQVRLGIEAPREVLVVRAELVPERLASRDKAKPRIRSEPTMPEDHPRAKPKARKSRLR